MQWNAKGGQESVFEGALSLRAIEDTWNSLFVERSEENLTQMVRSLRAAACGYTHTLLSFGPRIECDSLLQIAREHLTDAQSIHAFSDEPPSMYFSLKPGSDYLYVQAVLTVLPTWLSQEEPVQLLLFALLGPQQSVLEVADRLTTLLEGKRAAIHAPAEA